LIYSNIRDVRASWYFQSMYVATHNRAAPYMVGVIIGVLLYKLRNSSHRLGKVQYVLHNRATRRKERSGVVMETTVLSPDFTVCQMAACSHSVILTQLDIMFL
jgi:hypothetical protein